MLTASDHREDADEVRLYLCRVCDQEKPAGLMCWERGRESNTGNNTARPQRRVGPRVPTTRCLECSRDVRLANVRQVELRRRPDGAVPEPNVEGDPTPAQLLRACLAEDRAQGMTFGDAWWDEVAFVLGRIQDPSTRRTWERAFEGTRRAWQRGWDRSGPEFTLYGDPVDDSAISQVRVSSRHIA